MRGPGTYTSRIQKGGALLDDMRQVVRAWAGEGPASDEIGSLIRGNLLGKGTRTRSFDVLRRAFSQRFVEGSPPEAWRIVRPLEDFDAPIETLRPVYYWITARSDALLYDFVREEIHPRSKGHDLSVRSSETAAWIGQRTKTQRIQWSPTVTLKVARGLLAALRDFGLLQGAVKKVIAPAYLPVEAFAYIAFCLHQAGRSGQTLVNHPDWQLFLFDAPVVERLFMDAHQHRLLRYETAGNLYRIEFPADSYEEMAHVVTRSAY